MRKSLPFILAILLTGVTVGCKDKSKTVPAANTDVNTPAAVAPEATPEAPKTVVETIALNSENTTIEFEGSKVTGSHVGGFNDFEGTLLVSDHPHATSANVTIHTASVHSDDPKLTTHLQSDDFFDAETYPTAVFSITSIDEQPNADGTHTINAVLNMRGVERPISFPATVDITDSKVKVDSEFAINRKDWGIVYPGQKDNLIRDGVVLRIKINADRAAR